MSTYDQFSRYDANPNGSTHKHRILSITLYHHADDAPDYSHLEGERLEALENDEFCFIGIYAKAQIVPNGGGIIQTFRSGGLWGVESDSGDDYILSVHAEQIEELRAELNAYGIDFDPDRFASLAGDASDNVFTKY